MMAKGDCIFVQRFLSKFVLSGNFQHNNKIIMSLVDYSFSDEEESSSDDCTGSATKKK